MSGLTMGLLKRKVLHLNKTPNHLRVSQKHFCPIDFVYNLDHLSATV